MSAQIKASNFISERFNSFHNFMIPSSLLFLFTITIGTIVTLSSTNWLYLWMGIELNLLSFIPLIANTNNLQETEARVKYFIIQAVGRGLILTAGIISLSPLNNSNERFIPRLIFIIRIIIKLGIAPCHQWLPHVMARIPWIICIILATWQKISPIMILVLISPKELPLTIILIAGISTLTGGIGGLNQSQLRSLLAYSSIGHIGWLIITIQCGSNIFFMYFLVYILITTRLITLLALRNNLSSKFSLSIASIPPLSFLILITVIFSLGGLPPLLGFIPKWLIINSLSSKEIFIILTFLITGRLINLFYYFRIRFNFILTAPQSFKQVQSPPWIIIISILCTAPSLLIII